MSDSLKKIFLSLKTSISKGLSSITLKNKKSKKDENNTQNFQQIFEDITNDTFSKCESTNIENIDNNDFCKRIYTLGLDKDNLTTLINIVKTEFSKDKNISEKIISVEKLDSEIEVKKSELEKLKETQKTDLTNKKINLENEKTKIENETKELQQVKTDLTNKKINLEDLQNKEKTDLTNNLKAVEEQLNSNEIKIRNLESSHRKIITEIENLNKNMTEKSKEKEKINYLEKEIKVLEEKKSKNKNLTVNCITSKTPVPVMDYEKIVFFLNTRLDKLINDYENYYNGEEEKLKKIINDCNTIDIEEYCNNPDNNDYRVKASNCYKVYQINNDRLDEKSKKIYNELQETYELYCKKDEFKKDKLIKDINNYLESVINNHKLISNECKDAKCILSLMKNYEDNFKNFNVYLTGKFRGEDIYGEAPKMIKTLLMYNIDSIKDTDSNSDITNFFTNNSIKQDNLQFLKTVNYMTVLNIRKILRDWDGETKQLLDKIKSTKILKEQKQQKEEDIKKREEEKKKEQEQKRILSEKNRQEEAERERKIMEQRERENKEQREKEKRIELERAKQREHERTIEALKGKSSSSSSSSSSTDSTKSAGMGILMFTASAVLLGGVGIAFASK